MASLPKRQIQSALEQKGFLPKEAKSGHTYYYFYHNEKKCPVSTRLSRGTSTKTYGNKLLGKMKRQLYLDTTKQLIDLVNCPISKEDYTEILIQKGIIS